MILTFLIRGYILVGLIFFFQDLIKFLQDRTTPKTDKRSWIVLGLATVFWPIVVPLSHLERQANRKVQPDECEEEFEYRLSAPPLVQRDEPQKFDPQFSVTSTSEIPTRKNSTNIA